MDKKALDQVIWNEWSRNKTADIKPLGSDFIMDTMPFRARFKHSVQDERPFTYEAEGKFISFKPAGMWWTPGNGKVVARPAMHAIGRLVKGKVEYPNALGNGVDIELSTGRTKWRKEVTIKSLESLGAIPANAEFLEIGFEVETDFDIEGWDKKSDYQFNKAIKLGEMSQIESVKARDSGEFSEEEIAKAEEEDTDLSRLERCNTLLKVIDSRFYIIKQIPVSYFEQAVYPVITDTTISYGSEYPFNEAETKFISCAKLDDTHFVVAFEDNVDPYPGIAMIGVVTGDAIVYGDEYPFYEARVFGVSCAALDATHFVVGYRAVDPTYYGIARIGVVTGDAIAYGSEYQFNAAYTRYVSCAALDDTHFVVGFEDYGGDRYGIARIGVVSSGDVIAYGDESTFNAAAGTHYISCAKLDDTHFVVAFEVAVDPFPGVAKVGTVTGDAISFGSGYEFTPTYSHHTSCATLDATHFVVAYQDYAGTTYGYAKIGVVSSGDVIAYGDESTFNAANTSHISCAALDATHFVVGFEDTGGDKYGIARIGTVTGDAIAYGSEYPFNEAAGTHYISCAKLDDTHFVVGFKDQGGDLYGIAMIGSYTAPPGLENKSANMGSKMVAAGLI